MKKYSALFLSFLLINSLNIQTTYAGDVVNGIHVFDVYCSVCHSIKEGKNKMGPTLWKVVGRRPASISDYNYSDAMRSNNVAWTEDRISDYIANPQSLVPGVKMAFPGLDDAQKRDDLIAFLSTLR